MISPGFWITLSRRRLAAHETLAASLRETIRVIADHPLGG